MPRLPAARCGLNPARTAARISLGPQTLPDTRGLSRSRRLERITRPHARHSRSEFSVCREREGQKQNVFAKSRNRVWHLLGCPGHLPRVDNSRVVWLPFLYTLRTYIGIGEGAVTPIFAVIYIVALVRHKPWLAWCWLIKAFGALGINVYFLSQWLIRLKNFDHLRAIRPEYSTHSAGLPERKQKARTSAERPRRQRKVRLATDAFLSFQAYDQQFLWMGIGLTLAEVIILLLFCLIGGIFTYKVCEERRRSRRSLHRIHKMGRGRATAPPLDGYDDESSIVRANIEEQFLNHGLHDSTNKLPLPGSTSSMDEVGQASTLRPNTQV
ncbi:hypothetical protein C7M84_010957 [Penaeus vannamei]|uniref:Uncharacterized protein n=1 Tax=Penaeus vannamei TaxID=6689 RepID=A0A3R7PG71_PENVA|nr:hypothetical protein C7M84_010957 [Penaeus vannamei]